MICQKITFGFFQLELPLVFIVDFCKYLSGALFRYTMLYSSTTKKLKRTKWLVYVSRHHQTVILTVKFAVLVNKALIKVNFPVFLNVEFLANGLVWILKYLPDQPYWHRYVNRHIFCVSKQSNLFQQSQILNRRSFLLLVYEVDFCYMLDANFSVSICVLEGILKTTGCRWIINILWQVGAKIDKLGQII